MTIECAKCRRDEGDAIAIDIAFQPIFDFSDDSVFAYEALVRGPRGESAASVLAQVNARNCHRFDQDVRVTAIEKAVSLGLVATGAALSINIMPSAVVQARRCLSHVIEVAAAARLAHDRIIFEFTEDVRLDSEHERAIAATYRKHGFRTALDDFGAGYSGLVALADIPVDIVKLDLGLIRGIDRSPERRRIVGGLVHILRDLGRVIVAEGIETAGELAAVRKLGIALVQGFYLGMPSLTALQRSPGLMVHAA